MRYDVIVIAGTSESRQVIEEELKKGHSLMATVATELGAEMLEEYGIDVKIGRMDAAAFRAFFEENPCQKIIDASHPFAKIVTETVQTVAGELRIPYERFERQELDYAYDQIYTVADAKEAVTVLNRIEGNVILTTGVNTAAIYAEGVTDAKERVYIRVLDTPASYEGCDKAGYPRDHVYAEMPPYNLEDNLRVIRETNAKVMVSKDSGKTGGVDIKVQACKEMGIPMVLIKRPE